MLKVKNIDISISNKRLFIINEFDAYPKSISVIFGESGTGKTTFLEYLNNAHVDFMIDEYAIDSKNVRNYITLSKQESILIESLTVKENLDFYLNINSVKVDKELYDKLIRLLELNNILKQYPLSLSGGELRRVSLFIHCMLNKPVLLLDEPTASLDSVSIDKVIEVINIMKSRNTTIIISTHDDKIKDIADNLYEITNYELKHVNKQIRQEFFRIQPLVQNVKSFTLYKILRNRKKYKIRVSLFITCISLFVVSALTFSFIYGQASINVLKEKLNKNISNTMIVYKQIAPGVDQTFAYENFSILNEKEKNYLKNHQYIKDIKNYYLFSLTYVEDSSDKRHEITVFDSQNNQQKYSVFEKGVTLNYSTYYEEFKESKGIIKRFNDEGIYISEYLAEFLQIDEEHTTIGINLPILNKINYPGAYSCFYEGSDEYHYTTFHEATEVSEYVEIKVAGVYDYDSIAYMVDSFGMILLPNDLYESYIEKYQFEEPYVTKNPDSKIFPEITSYPYEPCAFTITYEPEHVEELMNDLYDNGFRYLSQYYDVESLIQAQKTNSNMFLFIGIIIFVVGCVISLVLNYIQRGEMVSINRIFKLHNLNDKTYYQIMSLQWIEDTIFISILSAFVVYMMIKFQTHFNFAYTEFDVLTIILIFLVSSVVCYILPFISNLISTRNHD